MSKIQARQIKTALEWRHTKRQRPDFFLTEVKNGSTHIGNNLLIMDAVALAKSWSHPCITGYEVKVSRGDFLQDTKWQHYMRYCHQFLIACPSGMITVDELPPEVGLVWYDREKDSLTTKRRATHRYIDYDANFLMYIIMSRLQPDRYPGFTDKQEHFNAWLEDKISDRELGQAVQSKLIKRNAELERQNERLQEKCDYATEITDEIDKMLMEHGITMRREYAIKELLKQDTPLAIKRAVESIEKNLDAIKKWAHLD